MINDPPNAPITFSYSRVFREVGTVYYRGADGRASSSSSSTLIDTTGVLRVEPAPVKGRADSGLGK